MMRRFRENYLRSRTVNDHRELTGSLKRLLERLENFQKVTIQRNRSLLNTGQLCNTSRYLTEINQRKKIQNTKESKNALELASQQKPEFKNIQLCCILQIHTEYQKNKTHFPTHKLFTFRFVKKQRQRQYRFFTNFEVGVPSMWSTRKYGTTSGFSCCFWFINIIFRISMLVIQDESFSKDSTTLGKRS